MAKLKKIEQQINTEFLTIFNTELSQRLNANNCVHCGGLVEHTPLGQELKYNLHKECVQEFIGYWSVALLGNIEALKDVQIIKTGARLSYNLFREEHQYKDIINHVAVQLATSCCKLISSRSIINDARAYCEQCPDCADLELTVYVKFTPVCMFCGGQVGLKPLTYTPITAESIIFPHDLQLETLQQTEDKKYIFHPTCLNNAIDKFKYFNGGHYET